MTTSTRTGMALKLARVAARIKQRELGAEMGVSGSRVAAIEREALVSAALAERYLSALSRVAHTRGEAAA